MALFPPNIWPVTIKEGEAWEAIVHDGPGGQADVNEVNEEPVFRGDYSYLVERPDFADVRAFHRACRGPAVLFDFFAYGMVEHELLACGTGDGSTLVFPAPLTDLDRTLQAPVVIVGGASKTEGTHFEIIVEQRLARSEELDNVTIWAAVGGAAVTRTGGQADPGGGTTAWRLQSTGGAAAAKIGQQALAASLLSKRHLLAGYLSVPGGAPAVTVSDGLGDSQTFAAGAGWVPLELQSDGDGSTPWKLELAVPTSGDDLDCYVWHPWGAVEDALWGPPSTSWRYGPSSAAAIAADSKRRHQLAFYSGSAPAAAAAITLSAVGRRLYQVRFLTDALEWTVDENLQLKCPLAVRQAP